MEKIDSILRSVTKIHFIGIGGSGMCPIAEILHKKGYQITGSDNNETDTLARIRNLGIPVFLGHSSKNLGDAELIIHTAAIMDDNVELCAARSSGVPTVERSVVLGAITRMYDTCIGIAGTHGKTTVSSMLTQILIKAEMDPTAVIGGKLPLVNANGIVGHSEIMVCEACEFKDHFLELAPDISIILNIDNDHMEYFGTMENMIRSYTKFAEMSTKFILVNGNDANAVRAVKDIYGKKILTFGLGSRNDYYPLDIADCKGPREEFTLIHAGNPVGKIELQVPGKHNILNAVAAAATALEIGVPFAGIAAAMKEFGGAGRRFELLGVYNGITVADDYAHHPEELRVTLETAMNLGYNKVWAVFQPFTYSRTAMLFDDFVRVLQIPDRVVMSEIMGSREKNTYDVYTKDLAEKIPGSVWFGTFKEIADYMVGHAQPGDLVITLGCGDIYKVAKMILEKYKAQI